MRLRLVGLICATVAATAGCNGRGEPSPPPGVPEPIVVPQAGPVDIAAPGADVRLVRNESCARPPALLALDEQVAERQRELDALLPRYTEQHPDVSRARRHLDTATVERDSMAATVLRDCVVTFQ